MGSAVVLMHVFVRHQAAYFGTNVKTGKMVMDGRGVLYHP